MVQDRFVQVIADLLGIRKPKIEYLDRVGTSTQMGGANVEKWQIGVKRDISEADQYFTVAHEMRHLWQSEHEPSMFRLYQTSNLMTTEKYNLQPAEVDANAFGKLVMEDCFRISPLFHGLSDEVKREITKRAEAIKKDIM